MSRRQSAQLDRKKFFADPVMLIAIFVLIVFLSLFILYPLAMLMGDSIIVRQTNLYPAGSLVGEEIALYDKNGAQADKTSGEAAYVKLTNADGER